MDDSNEFNSRSTTRESSFGLTSAAGVNILSQKVSRALELRTDTPAMASALDALAYLSSSTTTAATSNSSTSSVVPPSCNPQQAAARAVTTVVDPKLVRSIMEKDALNQALLYQSQLKSLLRSIADMKRSISNVTAIVESVQSAIEIDVCCVSECNTASTNRDDADPTTVGTSTFLTADQHQQSANTITATEGDLTSVDESQSPASLLQESSDDVASFSDTNRGSSSTTPAMGERREDKSLQAEQALAMKLHDAFVARDTCRKRYETLNRFLEKFQMTEQENELLQYYNFGQPSTTTPISSTRHQPQQYLGGGGGGGGSTVLMPFDPDSLEGFQFLDTLDKVRTVREELSKTLLEDDLGTTTQYSTASEQLGATSALRMMEKLAHKQEMAYERLYHFLQLYLNLNSNLAGQHPPVPTSSSMQQQQQQRILDRMTLTQQTPTTMLSDDVVEERLVHPFTKRALASLSHVPTFYSHCLELIASSRRAEVTRRFLLALTSGYDNVAPIEMRAHDPVSYVGDMLAFAFRTFSVESDLALGLFMDISSDIQEESNSGQNSNTVNEHGISVSSTDHYLSSITKSPMEMVGHCMSGIARPLKSRILQVISSLSRRPEEESYDISGNSLILNSSDKDGGLNDFSMEEGFEAIPTSARNRLAALYSLCGLLLFYQHQMGKTLERLESNSSQRDSIKEAAEGPAKNSRIEDFSTLQGTSNPLIQTVIECLREASESFVASLKVYCAMLQTYASMADESEADLAQAVVALILETRNSSPGFEPYILSLNPESASALSLELLCNAVIDAALSSCLRFEDAITLKEAVDAAKKAGLNKECVEKWQAEIGSKERDLVEDLVGKATGKMLHDCGLGSVAHALWNRELSGDTNPMATYPGLSQQDLQVSLQNFYSSLYSPPFPNFDSMKEPSLRNSSRAMTAANIVETYKQIYELVHHENAGYDDLSFISHNPEQVKALLS